jgi:hypothetical protein
MGTSAAVIMSGTSPGLTLILDRGFGHWIWRMLEVRSWSSKLCDDSVTCDRSTGVTARFLHPITPIEMSNVDYEINDDHPLALELSSLRTAVARFQV